MTKTRFNLVCFYCVFLFFTSCKDSKEYNINSSFTDYLQRFVKEGAARGHTLDPQAAGLIIEFADLKNNTAGLTHYETPIRIEIDKTYWNDISKTAGADLMKEDLIFHELGHGLLKRDHLNTTLANGDWKSMMCGGDKVNNRSWNINYRGERRNYYVDELFNESTPTPDFSNLQLLIDTTGYARSYFLSFNSEAKADAGWPIGDNADYSISIDNGRLRFQSKVNQVYLVFANLLTAPINIQSNFSFELTFEYPLGDASNQYGLIFGPVAANSSGVNDPIEYFSINNNQKMYMGNRSWYSFYTELNEQSIFPTKKNKLKVFKIGNLLYYFINNVYCYNTEIEAKDNLNKFGFMVPPQGVVWIDNFLISEKSSVNISAKVKQLKSVDFEVKTTNSLNQNTITNQ